MLNLHRVLLYTGIDIDDFMQIDCLVYKYFVFYCFSLVGYNIWYCVLIYFSLNVKATTLIFISWRGLAISSAKEGKSGPIYNFVKS